MDELAILGGLDPGKIGQGIGQFFLETNLSERRGDPFT